MGMNKVAPMWHQGAKPGDKGKARPVQMEKREKVMERIVKKRMKRIGQG